MKRLSQLFYNSHNQIKVNAIKGVAINCNNLVTNWKCRAMDWRIAVPFCSLLLLGFCGYPPRGEEVLPGSVLLPATRRGRYLANIVKRQAVDGTGIKFNEDADRMNAESKKKVDVLSEELLPYIIAEQERRTTLFRRIMTAIQNGEKGVTVAEVRNKHPLLIRRGLMYRCPSNRAIIEPDGSGIMMCENDVEPSPIMYDSCLSAEDKDVYVARNKFFFCNRHKVEGPDLPKNGSTVIGCAPSERTSLNYTYKKCALEETEDVVVQYRYYPDKTYKFVNDLDPDHEVCDHWNPCQVGYIFSLPSADQALPANELWHDYEEDDEAYERDETIPNDPDPDGSTADDFNDEFVHRDTESYRASPRRIKGARVKNESFWIECFWKRGSSFTGQNHGTYESDRWYYKDPYYYTELLLRHSGDSSYSIIQRENYNKYHFLTINRTDLVVHEISLNLALGQIGAVHTISFQGKGHRVKHVRVRAKTWQVYNLHPTVCKIKHDDRGAGTIEINLGLMSKKSFGHYFAIVDSPEGVEEKIRIMQVHQAERDVLNHLKSTHVVTSFAVGEPAEATMTYDCPQCQLVNVLCNGADVLDNGHVVPEPPNTIKINYPSFEDSHSCVYKGVFKEGNQTYETLLAVIDNNSPDVTIPTFEKVDAPKENEPFEQAIKYQCAKTCNVEKVYANGIPLTSPTNAEELESNLVDPDQTSSPATFKVSSSAITIHIDKYSEEYDGQYQAVFSLDDGSTVTKDIMEVINLNNTRRSAADNGRKYLTDANPSADHHITEEPIEGISDSRHVASTVANVADILTTRREELTILPSTNTIPTANSGNPTTILSFPTTVIDTTTPITTNVSSKP